LHEGGGVGDTGHIEDDRGGGGVAGGFRGERGGEAGEGVVGGGSRVTVVCRSRFNC
jgi:hypothetical protein